jgi:hypothetical protein
MLFFVCNPDRAFGARVMSTLSIFVLIKSALEIIGDTCVKRFIAAFDYVDEIHSVGAFAQIPENNFTSFIVAGLGLEPRYSPPEGDVLPLDDPALVEVALKHGYNYTFFNPLFNS